MKSFAAEKPKRNHASHIVIARPGKGNGEIEIVAFLYRKLKPNAGAFTSWKVPTETAESQTDRSEWDTAVRGAIKELHAHPEDPVGFEVDAFPDDRREDGQPPKPLITVTVPGDEGKPFRFHDKVVFRMMLTQGGENHFRTEERVESCGTEILGVPEYVEAAELLRRMEESFSPAFHVMCVVRTLASLAIHDKAVAHRYLGVLEGYTQYTGTTEQVQAHFDAIEQQKIARRAQRARSFGGNGGGGNGRGRGDSHRHHRS